MAEPVSDDVVESSMKRKGKGKAKVVSTEDASEGDEDIDVQERAEFVSDEEGLPTFGEVDEDELNEADEEMDGTEVDFDGQFNQHCPRRLSAHARR